MLAMWPLYTSIGHVDECRPSVQNYSMAKEHCDNNIVMVFAHAMLGNHSLKVSTLHPLISPVLLLSKC